MTKDQEPSQSAGDTHEPGQEGLGAPYTGASSVSSSLCRNAHPCLVQAIIMLPQMPDLVPGLPLPFRLFPTSPPSHANIQGKSFSLHVCLNVCSALVCVCLNVCVLHACVGILLDHSPHLILLRQGLSEPGTQLAACKPQHSFWLQVCI